MPPLIASAFSGFHSVWDFFEKGGLFMIPLGITCITGIAAMIYKSLSLAPARVLPEALARDVAAFRTHIGNGTTAPIIREFRKGESTLARLAATAVANSGKPRAHAIAAVEAAAREETVRLHSGIGILDIVITIAPLLGLVGTASGLVAIFQGLGETSDHLMISRGIAEALSTTIFGISVAIPAIIAHGYFFRRIEKLTARLESLLADLTSTVAEP